MGSSAASRGPLGLRRPSDEVGFLVQSPTRYKTSANRCAHLASHVQAEDGGRIYLIRLGMG